MMQQISLFARHKTAANLLMMFIVILGVVSLTRLNTQFFPDLGFDVIRITIPWSGASAEDIDRIIVEVVDPELRTIDGLDEAQARAYENQAQFMLEFKPGTNMQKALSDVTSIMSRISQLPEDSEDPIISLAQRRDSIATIILSGPFPLDELGKYARQIETKFLQGGIDKVSLSGLPQPEIQIDIDPALLPQHQLSLADIGRIIRQNSQDLPAGQTEDLQRYQIRSIGRRDTVAQIKTIPIYRQQNGQEIRLEDIAQVTQGFKDGSIFRYYEGFPAIELNLQRALSSDALKQAQIMNDTLAELRLEIPASLTLKTYDVTTDAIQDRIDLLLSNGLSGLLLVIVVLFLFLSTRVAVWVAAGIPIAILGTFIIMFVTGQSINMISLFALIMSLGIIVDDAIVVGEHVDHLEKGGEGKIQAAIKGARRMFSPVFSASITTAATFLPMLLIGGVIGQIMAAIPVVILSVLAASLLECFLILPGHLGHSGQKNVQTSAKGRVAKIKKALSRTFLTFPLMVQRRFNQGFLVFREQYFARALLWGLRYRYIVIMLGVACFVIALGLMKSGQVRFIFFPSPESNAVYANVEMVSHADKQQTLAMLQHFNETAEQAAQNLEKETGFSAKELIDLKIIRLGSASGVRGGGNKIDPETFGSIQVELIDSEKRPIRTKQFIAAWRKLIKPHAAVQQWNIYSRRSGPPGRDVDIRLAGGSTQRLKESAGDIKRMLRDYNGVSNVEDDMPNGKPELQFRLTSYGESLGLTSQQVAQAFRDNFEGVIAQRLAQGEEELTIRVQIAPEGRQFDDFYHQQMQLADGRWVYLGDVISLSERQAPSRIRRDAGQREIGITADLNNAVTTTDEIIAALKRDGIEDLVRAKGLSLSFSGRAKEQSETFADMAIGFGLGIFTIYGVLAWIFSSYTRPFVVIAIIPIGFAGAVFGHWIVGYDLTILSIFGILGLSGIVVNDSIVLVTTIHEKPISLRQIFSGTVSRLRAVLLTSATTIGGLMPLMFETSLQAQFLIPMALSIVSGLMMATFLVLFLVPALIAFQMDISLAERRKKKSKLAIT